jgi:tetratricopeptide (TPR) repeat protein
MLAIVMLLAQQVDAQALWDSGRREEAVAVLAQQVERAPADAKSRMQLARAELAIHRNAAALEHLAPLGVEADPVRGTALFRLGKFEQALACLARDDADQVLMRIDALESLGRTSESDELIPQLAKLLGESDPRVTTQRGRSLSRAGKYEEAAAQFRLSLARDACDAAAMFGLGTALVRSGKRDEGLAVLAEHRRITPLLDQLDFAQRSVDLAPAHAGNHASVGDAQRALGRIELAETEYRMAEKLASAADLAPIALRHARLVAEDRKDPGSAVKLLDETAARAPDARLFVRAGDLLSAAGDFDGALTRYESAARLRPDDAEIQRRVAKARAHEQ